jgi:hypothetical protein
MFVIDWILAKFNYHKFHKVDMDALWADIDRSWAELDKKELSDKLDRVRITTANGTDAFDAGSINILYE